ncbi:nuclear transport factor 2 family protein [Paraburkholderia silvatlantica]|uniref:SnoaL-like protein n=1 Tax=Paraburkholderia silvatlantica TaxID=321895 RepID=A0A2U1A9U0_9BURK|nr:nuclear transport factor 2 family protein [Paraburkholderia silvatlantica]MBB2930635.1 hypothetical protein [Paraburkholderia silvatlantica]PVY30436.1 SnoaL-like protein [Paraburkholderia silvatlantica]PXW36827.1 SnoaL-like protein [Paraburkholderia silvatlantica]PYE21168.1 SnoaL-like protein [Paraburkholderia silvatlantica]TDQ86691.1 SnoaL-like protein [Paraburkholderia silvatlantica]
MSAAALARAGEAALHRRLAVLEAEHAVRRTTARYMALCDVPSGALADETLASLFTGDAIWEGVGPLYARKFGRIEGREAILAMLTRYLPPTPHFSVNAHFLSAEQIDVCADATQATGRWLMLQASRYVNGGAELIAARLEVDFVPCAASGAWLMRHFRTRRLFDAPWQVTPSPTDT